MNTVSKIIATAAIAFSINAQAADVKDVAVATQNSMMTVVNRSMDSGLCSMEATRALRKASFEMATLNKAGQHEEAMKIAHQAFVATRDKCGVVKTSMAASGAVGYFGTYNALKPTQTIAEEI